MFLSFTRFSHLLKLPIRSSASRNTTRFHNMFCLQKLMKPLSLRINWKAGRVNGKTILKTHTSLLRKYKTPRINYNLRYVQLNWISSFQFISSINKLITLVHFANGSATYYITTENHRLFSYCYLTKKKFLRNLVVSAYWSPVYFLNKLIFVSFVQLTPSTNAQYSLSAGTQSRLMVIDKLSLTGLIELPSKVKKTISYYSFVLLGKIALQERKKYKNTKSGYWRSRGEKSIVRGVAMNPVDHPHGGRTKSVRYPRTPWGKTTKFK